MDKDLNKEETLKNEKTTEKSNKGWIVSVFFTTFFLSLVFSVISTNVIEKMSITSACIFLVIVVLIGIIFDMVAIAVTVADEGDFHAKATKKIPGSKISVKLIRNAPKVANFCADVIGDICGVLSGAVSALIGIKIAASFTLSFNVQLIIGAAVAAVTVAGKAIGKAIATHHSTEIVHVTAKILNFLHLNRQ